METTTNEMVSQETRSILQLKRSLLPIDEYATREGASRGIVEACGKLGIIQIRKYKGKIFVVDVPLSPYFYTPETTAESTQPNGKTTQTKKISELVQKVIPDASETPDKPAELDNQDIKAGTISALVKKMFRKASPITNELAEKTNSEIDQLEDIPEPAQTLHPKASETTDQLAQLTEDSDQSESLPEPIQTPNPQTLEITDEPSKLVDETVETEEKPKSPQTIQDNGNQLGLLTAQVKSRRTWQFAAVFLIVCLFAALFGNFWLYMDRKIQLDKLDQVYATIQKVYDDSIQANQQVENLQNKLAESGAEVERLKNELDNSRAEVKTVRNELAQARQILESIQQRDAQVVERLNKQIQKLAARLTELTEKSQNPSSPGISGN